tara:strand:- start:259 stop:564 length:306 start_codon:yes stop_codon:yes gene_type:complete
MNPIVKLTAHQASLFFFELGADDYAMVANWKATNQDNLLALVDCLNTRIIPSELIETATEEARMIVDVHAGNIQWEHGEELAELRKIIATMKRILKTLEVK